MDLWLLKVLICFRSICWKNAFIKDQMIFSISKISSIMCLLMCPAIGLERIRNNFGIALRHLGPECTTTCIWGVN